MGYLLPATIDPPRICVTIKVPDDANHLRAFRSQIFELSRWWNWQRDSSKQGRLAAQVWQDVYQDLILNFPNATGCTSLTYTLQQNGCNIELQENGIVVSSVVLDGTACPNLVGPAGPAGPPGQDGATGPAGPPGQDGQDGATNEYPPAPTSAQPNELCNAAFYIVDKLQELIAETWADATTITLEEFLNALLGIGGFDASLLKLFWDQAVASANPNVPADVQSARATLAEIWYCNDLDRDAVRTEIDNSSLAADVKAASIGVLDSVTDAKIALWAFVGSNQTGADCSAFCSGGVNTLVWLGADGNAGITIGNTGDARYDNTTYTSIGGLNVYENLSGGISNSFIGLRLNVDLGAIRNVQEIRVTIKMLNTRISRRLRLQLDGATVYDVDPAVPQNTSTQVAQTVTSINAQNLDILIQCGQISPTDNAFALVERIEVDYQ